jgi:hypothetical protein
MNATARLPAESLSDDLPNCAWCFALMADESYLDLSGCCSRECEREQAKARREDDAYDAAIDDDDACDDLDEVE